MKYICRMGYIANCPTCDGTYPDNIKFFNSLKEMFKYALDNLGTYEIEQIYSKSGKNLKDLKDTYFSYENAKHNSVGIIFKRRSKKLFRTIDNGSGTLIWKKLNENT